MGISHFAKDQTEFELEKGKHFLKVPFCNLLTDLSFSWFGSCPY